MKYIYNVSSRSFETKAVSTKAEMIDEWSINFSHTKPRPKNLCVRFPLIEIYLKFLFSYLVKLCHPIFFNVLDILKFYVWNKFSV